MLVDRFVADDSYSNSDDSDGSEGTPLDAGLFVDGINMHYCKASEIGSPHFNKIRGYELLERSRRAQLLRETSKNVESFEVELVNAKGAHWGKLFILETIDNSHFRKLHLYLYFQGMGKILEKKANVNSEEYHFRSFPETQKSTNTEILIDLEAVREILCKLYLLNPVAIELYYVRNPLASLN